MIWKALSDPTRRSILSSLKKAPQTTGELSDSFKNLSRYAVMKHLGILEKANLITVKRDGKFRWNYLNTTPIQQTYEQWVSNLIQLKYLAEQTTETMGESSTTITTTTVFIELTINAKKARVWQALTEETGQWWKKDFYTNPKTREFVLDSRLGGLMYEDAGGEEGLVWASVIGIDSPNSLQLKGQLSPKFGGPAISFMKIQLEDSKGSTLLKITDTIIGSISEDLQKNLTQGWQAIFEEGLKPYVETTN
jgi:DNA-binding transcriptional ArsR family regulator